MPRSAQSLAQHTPQISLIARFASRIGLAAEGVPIVVPVLAAGLGLAVFESVVFGGVLLTIGAALAGFFRDPERLVVAPEGA
ncbi:MAG: hypothetical protein JO166_08885, partial [Deltaproteobacteria bacterium]|nr:hypothetical protein [Deltaproteobacteria bacterium]